MAHSMLTTVTRRVLWLGLLTLTVLLLAWPVAPSPEDSPPVEIVSAIRHFDSFLVLIYVWVGFLLVLLLQEHSVWSRFAICATFAAVLIGSWGIRAPWGNHPDSPWFLAHVQYLFAAGKVPSAGLVGLRYFDFPGFPLIGVLIQKITGLEPFKLMLSYTIASGLALTLMLHAAFLKFVSPNIAPLAVMAALLSSKILGVVSNQFHPINLATLYIVVFVLLLPRFVSSRPQDRASQLIFAILTLAATIEYLFTPVLFAMTLVWVCVLNRSVNHGARFALASGLFPLATLLAWDTYATVHNFHDTFGAIPRTLGNLINLQWLQPTGQLLAANVGQAYPWWGNLSRLFWWVTVFLLGTVDMLSRLRTFREATVAERAQLAFLMGLLTTVAVGFFSIPVIGVVHGGLSRYLWVAPFVLVPWLMRRIYKPPLRGLSAALVVVAAGLFPATFLSNADLFSTQRLYSQEVRASAFLASATPQAGKVPLVYGLPTFPTTLLVYIPELQVRSSYLYGVSPAVAWEIVDGQKRDFLSDPRNNLGIVSAKSKGELHARHGISSDGSQWRVYEAQLERVDRLYDNGLLRVIIN